MYKYSLLSDSTPHDNDEHIIVNRLLYMYAPTVSCPWRALRCCSVWQCVAVCCSVLQCVGVCCSVLQCVAESCSALQRVKARCSALSWVARRCRVIPESMHPIREH